MGSPVELVAVVAAPLALALDVDWVGVGGKRDGAVVVFACQLSRFASQLVKMVRRCMIADDRFDQVPSDSHRQHNFSP